MRRRGTLATLRRMHRRLNDVPFAVVIGLLGVNSALTLYLNPARQPTHLLLAPWDYLWSGLYGIGGAHTHRNRCRSCDPAIGNRQLQRRR